MGACLGGNGSLIGASANLIVAGAADRAGHHISFIKFIVLAFPLMLLSVAIASVYIYLRYL
jgi:Na+/H+ antiporter NhaD/arsenite permease-like protein